MSKFISSNSDDCKLHLRAMSRLVASIDLKLVAANNDTFNPDTHLAIPNKVFKAVTVLSTIGQAVVVYVQSNGLETLPVSIQDTFEQKK